MKNKLIIIVAIIIAVVGTVLFWKHQLKNKKQAEEQKQQVSDQRPAINGVPVSKDIAKSRPIAVVVENHPDARPQSGLYQADIVYETLAEGGITRFLALFQTQMPKEIGPVRSARPYFNNIAQQWSAAYAHVGGSQIALSELDSKMYTELTDINQFFFGDYFYRNPTRVAPHNAYTTIELIRKLMDKKKWTDWKPIKLGEFETIPTEKLQTTVTDITAKFYDSTYTTEFTFDPTTGLYNRMNGGRPTIDKNNNTQIAPRNVVVQYVDDYSVPMEPVNGVGLKLEHDGRAILFTGGAAVDGTWRFKNGFTEYRNEQGEPMKFQPGQTWIILMPRSLSNNVTWK